MHWPEPLRKPYPSPSDWIQLPLPFRKPRPARPCSTVFLIVFHRLLASHRLALAAPCGRRLPVGILSDGPGGRCSCALGTVRFPLIAVYLFAGRGSALRPYRPSARAARQPDRLGSVFYGLFAIASTIPTENPTLALVLYCCPGWCRDWPEPAVSTAAAVIADCTTRENSLEGTWP